MNDERGKRMKHTKVLNLLTNPLLRFIRDQQPTVADFLEHFGGPNGQVFHVLRKAEIFHLEGERLCLNSQWLSEDGRSFAYGAYVYWLDSEEVWHVCYGPASQKELT